jgi:16S rRNA (cytosine967-C5)-methyltransferase
MPGSAVASSVFLAWRTLILVEDGWSERGGLAHVSRKNPSSTGKKEALGFVLGVLARRNLVDRVIETCHGNLPSNKEQLSLARLVVHLFLGQTHLESRWRELDALRRLCPDYYRTEFEKLVGNVLANEDPGTFIRTAHNNDRVALETGFPTWWVEYCERVWGRDFGLQLLRSGPRPRYLHVNNLRADGKLVVELARIRQLEPLEQFDGFYRLKAGGLERGLRELLEEGTIEAQDLASFLAVKAGTPQSGDIVLDVCSAPGAKTGALAQLMHNEGEIVSIDYSARRMRDWARMIKKLGVSIASGLVADVTRPGLRGDQIFDLILVDPPCTGSGISDRNPGMRWHLSEQRLAKYSDLQYRILEQSSRLLKPTGRIVYSTCSIALEENENVISRFLSSHPEFEVRPVLDGVKLGSPGLRGWNNCRRFYPHKDDTAGYFIARLERVA